MAANKLSLNLVKTEYLLIGSRHKINNLFHAPKVHVGDMPIKRVEEQRHLGSILMNIYLGISTLKYFEKNLIRHRGGQETKASC